MPIDAPSDDGVRALLRTSRTLPPLDASRTAVSRAAVHAAWVAATRAPSRRGRWYALAASAVIAAGLYGLWHLASTDRIGAGGSTAPPAVATVRYVTAGVRSAESVIQAGERLAAGAIITTGSRGRGTLVLEDGTEVRLDVASRVRVLSATQLAVDSGALYVDTTSRRQAGAELTIIARGVTARDIGTRFEVRVGDAQVRVRVRDGIVRVRHVRGTRDVGGGSALSVTGAETSLTASPVWGPEWAWTVLAAPAPIIEGRTLREFLTWVAHESGRRVRFADPELERDAAGATVYGSIEGLSVDEALEVVLPSCGLSHRLEGETIVITADARAASGR